MTERDSPSVKKRFLHLVSSDVPAAKNVSLREWSDPFGVSLSCDFSGIGEVTIDPFAERHFERFTDFYDRRDPEWDLSADSRAKSDQHDTHPETLRKIAARVEARQDARFVVATQGRVIGYLSIEEIDRIAEGKPNSFGEAEYACLDIAISDPFHGTGLARLAMHFLKLVAVAARVKLGLVTSETNPRAIEFYRKLGFRFAGQKLVRNAATGKRTLEPWFVLERDELMPDP